MKVPADAIQPRKLMAMGKSGPSIGSISYLGRNAPHPDAKCSNAPMSDAARGSPTYGRQVAPDHGIGVGAPDHFNREGKV